MAYATRLRDGTVVDSSGERGATFLPASPGLMPCFREAVLRMRVGGKSRFVCPPALAYGDRGYGSAIPGGAALVIEAELVAVGKPLSVVGH